MREFPDTGRAPLRFHENLTRALRFVRCRVVIASAFLFDPLRSQNLGRIRAQLTVSLHVPPGRVSPDQPCVLRSFDANAISLSEWRGVRPPALPPSVRGVSVRPTARSGFQRF